MLCYHGEGVFTLNDWQDFLSSFCLAQICRVARSSERGPITPTKCSSRSLTPTPVIFQFVFLWLVLKHGQHFHLCHSLNDRVLGHRGTESMGHVGFSVGVFQVCILCTSVCICHDGLVSKYSRRRESIFLCCFQCIIFSWI